jgi:hypothetical protein
MSTVKQPDHTIRTPPEHPRHQDELLDEAIEESFPASDPVSISIDPPPPGERKVEDPPAPPEEPEIDDPMPGDDAGEDEPVRRAGPGSATG